MSTKKKCVSWDSSTYWQKLQDPRWQKKRLDVFQRDGFACRDCSATDKPLHVHHCFYEKGEPWDTSEIFLLTICADCHEARGEFESRTKRALGIIFSESKPKQIIALHDAMLNANAGEQYLNEFHNKIK